MVRLKPESPVIRMASPEATGTVPSMVPVVACPQAVPEKPMIAELTASASALRCRALLRCNRRKDALFIMHTPLVGERRGKPLLVFIASVRSATRWPRTVQANRTRHDAEDTHRPAQTTN